MLKEKRRGGFKMKTNGNVVLITGGSAGIGHALAEKFLQANNKVIITGRNEEKLLEVKEKYHEIIIEAADSSNESDLTMLAEKYQDVNILINNAGVQYNYVFNEENDAPALIKDEFSINLIGPLLLIKYFLPNLISKKEAAIINVSSGLGLVPKQSAPVYCASKAGLHMFSKSLRYQLESTNIKLFEIIPPLVDTKMTEGRGKGKITAEQLTDEFWRSFKKDKYEIQIGKVKLLHQINRFLPALAEKIMKGELYKTEKNLVR